MAVTDIEIEELGRFRLEPEDILVLRYKRALTCDDIKRVTTDLEKLFPDNTVLLLDNDTKLNVLSPSANGGGDK